MQIDNVEAFYTAAYAKPLGRQEDLQLLLQTLGEEKRTDALLPQVAERSVNQKAA